MFDGDRAHQMLAARFAERKLGPAMRRLGWSPRADETANDAVLRSALLNTLGELGDPEVVREANRRFAANDPSVAAGPLRQTILGIVAYNADAATWERLRTMARSERNPLVKGQLYGLLGAVRDEALARRALELALTDEPGTTNASQVISSVAQTHPDLAFDFAVAHREQVEALVDASSRSRYLAALGSGSSDPAMIEKLTRYAEAHMTPQSRAPVDRAIASIRDRIRVRTEQRPLIGAWMDEREEG
jgi:aminopeptidase N